jgi:hypothetical protein
MSVRKISQDKVNQIEKKTVKTLPDDPSKQGYSPDQIKRRMYAALLDPDNSIVAEVNRIVDEVNQAIVDIGLSISVRSLIIYDSVADANAANLPPGQAVMIKIT